MWLFHVCSWINHLHIMRNRTICQQFCVKILRSMSFGNGMSFFRHVQRQTLRCWDILLHSWIYQYAESARSRSFLIICISSHQFIFPCRMLRVPPWLLLPLHRHGETHSMSSGRRLPLRNRCLPFRCSLVASQFKLQTLSSLSSQCMCLQCAA
jgi:hypothetical protein